MDPTFHVGRNARDVVVECLPTTFVAFDVGLDWERAGPTFIQTFVYETNDEVVSLIFKNIRAYTNECLCTYFEVLSHKIHKRG